MACVKCNRGILSDENQYIAADLGPELLFIIEQAMAHEIVVNYSAERLVPPSLGKWMVKFFSIRASEFPSINRFGEAYLNLKFGCQIAADAVLCDACFNTFTNLLKSTHKSTEATETNRCVWCLSSLTKRRTHYLTNGPQRDAISNVISPRQIPDGGIVCHRCWVYASRLVNVSASNSGQLQHVCVWCRHSLSQRRTHIISHGPERDEITIRIAPRQILPGDRVCYACWVSARRIVQRATYPHLNRRNVCVACSTSIVRRPTHLLLNGPERDIIARRIYPRQVSNHTLVCNDCWIWAQDAVHGENKQTVKTEPQEEEPQQVLDMPHHIELKSYPAQT